ncbi:unnamed protein product, partial [marine sediment metagenome]
MISDPNLFRKTKIVCTIGPASGSDQMIEKLALAGMNVARLNFSHGTYEQHATHIEAIRRVSSKLSLPLAILQDLPGPKIRTGELKKEAVWLNEGDDFTLTNKQVVGDEHIASVSLASLPNDVSPGNIIFLNDGAIKLEVVSTTNSEIRCKVVVGGMLAPKRGVNIPSVRLNVPSITDEDLSHLLFG